MDESIHKCCCGACDANIECKLVHTKNGMVFLCDQCLSDINRANPEMARLKAQNDRLIKRLQEAIKIMDVILE